MRISICSGTATLVTASLLWDNAMIDAFVPRSAMSVVQRPTSLLQPKYSCPFTSLGAATDGSSDSDFENNDNDDNTTGGEDEASRLRKRAEDLREQIRKMEATLGDKRPRNYDMSPPPPSQAADANEETQPCSLKKKRVLVVGANGRLGSMVCRYLLRNNPQTEVVACVHYVGENSMTSRGYGRLSYEVGAEDGVGRIGAAWSSSEDRTATFEYADYMKDYNLKNLRLVECELLDPVQCNTICEGVDSVIWCASDFNGNKPRAISGLNVAFLFRAIAAPTKGRVEIEGLRNLLGGLKNSIQERKWKRQRGGGGGDSASGVGQSSQPINVALVSTTPEAFADFETPFGTFNGLKREGEDIVKNEFPSLSYTILQMGRYDDNFVPEDLDILFDQSTTNFQEGQRRINRRDAAKAAVDALTDADLVGKTVQVWTKG
jgi:hypothetical protein